MCQTILYNSAQVSGGMSFIFNAIVAVVVGGVLLTGGFGSVIGIFFGTLTFAIVNQGIYFTAVRRQLVEPDHRHPAAARRADEQHLPQDGAHLQPEEGEEVMATPILELRNVNKSFGPIDVLHDISLKVDAGEVLCLLGDNGAGKSTLIKILSGVHKPTSGTVLMDGKEVGFASPREAQRHGHRHRAPVRRNLPADERRALLLRRPRADEEMGAAQGLRPRRRRTRSR